MITRRELIICIGSCATAITSPILFSLVQKQSSISGRRRTLPFLLGWYEDVKNIDVASKVSAQGIDLLMPYVGHEKKETIQAFLNISKNEGVKVLLEIYRPLVESGDISAVLDFIRTYKNHPSVYGWYLYDEPEVKYPNPISPDLLINLYQAIKKEDKLKPVALVFGHESLNKIEAYTSAMDIVMWDRYPCIEGDPEFQWARSYRAAVNKVFDIADPKKKKFWNVLQAYSGHDDYKKRLPTKAEFRYMFYLSVLAGADGLLFWMHPWSTRSWNESVLYPTIQEFKKYITAFIRGKELSNSLNVNPSNIEVKLFTIPDSQKLVAIAINHNSIKTNVRIKVISNFTRKAVFFNKKTIDNIDITLTPYEVRLYEF